MASSSKLIFFLSPIFVHFLALGAVAQLKDRKHVCYPNAGNYTTNSPYEANLNHLLDSLTTKTGIDYGFYNFSYGEKPDTVYAIGICRPDMDSQSCHNCIREVSKSLTSFCPNFFLAIAWFDDDVDNYCMLRYANYDIFGLMENAPYFFVHTVNNMTDNLVEFNQTRNRLLNRLFSEAAARNSPYKYAVGNETVTGILRLYALVQCNPDLSKADCNQCLNDAAKLIPECCDLKEGGRVTNPSCNFRYETGKFYKPSIEGLPVSPTPSPDPKGKKNRTVIIVVCSVVGSLILMLFIGCGIFFRIRKTEDYENMEGIENGESFQFNFSTIRDATDNFSDANKLGQGGFGVVYKGMLSDGQQIAVKRLAMNSNQGDLEFKNEVIFVAKLQHRNLVRLLGFCLERKERILVYEFLPNSSLDHFIFDPIKREFLQWDKRYKIIEGIARGLQYLHEDSRLRIIHRDLKTSNVLLDSELNPKISDFGMARLFEMDQTQSDTNRVVGTFGYMAPEYVKHGRISIKSDVYSFGTLVLEIMSGQKISSFGTEEEPEDLLSYAWKNWNEGTDSNTEVSCEDFNPGPRGRRNISPQPRRQVDCEDGEVRSLKEEERNMSEINLGVYLQSEQVDMAQVEERQVAGNQESSRDNGTDEGIGLTAGRMNFRWVLEEEIVKVIEKGVAMEIDFQKRGFKEVGGNQWILEEEVAS
ncbi:hypothetical protein LWI28_016643 [Acer negundo]|uniref:Uncharacterized protein n=1 Tax=Acer negundo TaxID=4023 RepID=A0AAD5JFK2_ACENE|nr:hypothetical protein LWI28_016643 [Acer negundo]